MGFSSARAWGKRAAPQMSRNLPAPPQPRSHLAFRAPTATLTHPSIHQDTQTNNTHRHYGDGGMHAWCTCALNGQRDGRAGYHGMRRLQSHCQGGGRLEGVCPGIVRGGDGVHGVPLQTNAWRIQVTGTCTHSHAMQASSHAASLFERVIGAPLLRDTWCEGYGGTATSLRQGVQCCCTLVRGDADVPMPACRTWAGW